MYEKELILEHYGKKIFQKLDDSVITNYKKTDNPKYYTTTKSYNYYDQDHGKTVLKTGYKTIEHIEHHISTLLYLDNGKTFSLDEDLPIENGMHVKTSYIEVNDKENIVGRMITGINYKYTITDPFIIIYNELYDGLYLKRNNVKEVLKGKDSQGNYCFDLICNVNPKKYKPVIKIPGMKKIKGYGKYINSLFLLWVLLPLLYIWLSNVGVGKLNPFIRFFFYNDLPSNTFEVIYKWRYVYGILVFLITIMSIFNMIKTKKENKINKIENQRVLAEYKKKKQEEEEYRKTDDYKKKQEEEKEFYEYCKERAIYADNISFKFLEIQKKSFVASIRPEYFCPPSPFKIYGHTC